MVERRPVTVRELCADVQAGRRFRAYRHDTGADCTNEVLVEVLVCGLTGPRLASTGDPGTVLSMLLHSAREAVGEVNRGHDHSYEPADPPPRRRAR